MNRSAEASGRRLRVAQALALIALVAALIGALGPADWLRTTYSWPPPTLPREEPDRLWYTPLLLIRHQPEVLSTDLPCALPPFLPNADRPGIVLATARYPEKVGGLAITRSRNELVVAVGGVELDRIALPAGGGSECAHRLTFAGGGWVVSGGPNGIERRGVVQGMPIVTGLFSGLDLRAGPAPSVDVRTQVHATRVTARQTIAWVLAALGATAALVLVAIGGRPRRPWSAISLLASRALRSVRLPDAVVGAALLGWWILSPAYLDDGWVIARELMYSSSGGFSNYYSNIGANLPLNYWHEWVEHWLVEASTSLLFLRLQALLLLGVTWICCRWVLSRVLASSVGESKTALWTLTSVFLVGAMSWGMTLRPEPLTAALAMGVMICALVFVERGTTAPIVVAAILVALALSSHHAGVVAFAPLLVAAPHLYRWIRARFAVATTIFAATCALFAVLLFVGSDLEQRRLDAQITRLYGATGDWRDEIARYAFLSAEDYGTPLRRLSVVLIGLAILAFVLRKRRERKGLLDFPASVLTVGIALLILTPSKWPSHFGALLGFAAVAFAAEAARLREEAGAERRWQAWPFLAVVAASAAATWSWWTREQWNVVDLRTLDWFPGLEADVPFVRLATLLPVVVLAAAVMVAFARGRRETLPRVPWRVASWTAPLLAVPLFAFTVGILVSDAAKAESWTLTQQNLSTLLGDPACGLAEELDVPVPDSVRPLAQVRVDRPGSVPSWVPAAPVADLPRFALGPVGRGAENAPWFELPARGRVGVFVAGAPGIGDTLRVEWGRRTGDRVEVRRSGAAQGLTGALTGNSQWLFLSAAELPTRGRDATVVRTTLVSNTAPGAAIAVTAPVVYTSETLAEKLDRDDPRTLVLPNLVTYFPCARLPQLGSGIFEIPRYVLVSPNPHSPLRYPVSGPFAGLVDVYELVRLSTGDSRNPPDDALVYEVDQDIDGATLAPPVKTTRVS